MTTYLIHLIKLGRVITFMKYLARVVSLVFLVKSLIWNKIMFVESNLLTLAMLVVNEPMKSIYKKFYQYYFFYTIYHDLQKSSLV